MNELDFTCGISDDELTARFKEAIRIDNEIKKIKGVPIAGYDVEKKQHIWNIRMEGENMQQNNVKLPEIIVFAGPNGSGKSTITKMAKVIEPISFKTGFKTC